MTDNIEAIFENIKLETPSNTDTSVKNVIQTDAPHPLSPEWNDYVMGLFTETEMVDGNPLVHGLRRVSEMLLGQIVFSGPTQVFPVQRDDHHGRATVIFTVEFSNGIRYSEVADSWEGNTDDTFCAYAVAIASTRAEARALRKALKIRAVAAEELTKKDTAAITAVQKYATDWVATINARNTAQKLALAKTGTERVTAMKAATASSTAAQRQITRALTDAKNVAKSVYRSEMKVCGYINDVADDED